MPSSTKNNKEKSLLFSDLALLERTIQKEKRTASIDNNFSSSTDTSQKTSTDPTNPSTDTSRWLKLLPPRSLTSWTKIKNAFLRNFFDESWVEDLKRNIATHMNLHNHSEAPKSNSSPIRETVHTMDSTKCSCSSLSLESLHWHIRWIWTLLVKETSTLGI